MRLPEEVLKNYTNFEQVQANQPSEIVAIHEIITHISTIGQKITKNYITLLSYKKNQPGVFEESNPSDIIKSLIAKSPILRKIYTRVNVYSLGLLIKRIISPIQISYS